MKQNNLCKKLKIIYNDGNDFVNNFMFYLLHKSSTYHQEPQILIILTLKVHFMNNLYMFC